MFPRVVQQANHVMVVERVVRHPPRPPRAYEPGGAEQTQLMGDRGFGQANQPGEVADTPLTMGQRVDQTDASGVAKQPEDVRHGLDDAGSEQAALDRGQGPCIGVVPWIAGLEVRSGERRG